MSIGKINTEIPLAELSSHLRILLCVPPVSAVPLLLNIVQMLATYIKKTNQKMLVSTARLIEVTDRYSSAINATSPIQIIYSTFLFGIL